MARTRREILGASGTSIALSLAGCMGGSQDEDDTPEDRSGGEVNNSGGNENSQESESWRYGTAAEGTGAASMGQAYSVAFEEASDRLSLSPQTTQGYFQNIQLMNQGNMEAAFAHNTWAYWAHTDSGQFEENPVDAKPLQGHPVNQVLSHHWLVRKDSDIETVADLSGSDVHTGVAGGSLRPAARTILEAEGVLQDVNERQMQYPEAKSAFQSGEIDAFFTAVINMRTNSASLELWQTMDVDLTPMTDEGLENLVENPFFSETTISTDHPKWPDEMDTEHDEFQGPEMVAYGVLHPDLDEDLVYHSMEVFHENQERIGELNNSLWGFGWGTVTLEGEEYDRWGLTSAVPEIPFHKGAADYLKEIGEWNDDWQVA